jgi:citrate lyase alpha subunit
MRNMLLLALLLPSASALVPLLDGGKQMPALYNGWLNEQIAKQASTGVANAIAAGYNKIEVQFPPVPNLDEVGFAPGFL